MAYPAIVYDPGSGPVGLRFSFPPTQKPDLGDGAGDELQPLRFDSYTLAGPKQSVLVRIDVFRTLQLEFVPFSDLRDWSAFMRFAQTGAQFHYHPDADLTDYDILELDDNQGGRSTRSGQGWAPVRAVRGAAKFDLNVRVVGSGTGEVVP
jgi:hypothetical protein